MPLTYKLTKKILNDIGFILDRQTGSHQQRKINNKIATVPFHDEYNIKTAKSILNQIYIASWVDSKKLMSDYNIKL